MAHRLIKGESMVIQTMNGLCLVWQIPFTPLFLNYNLPHFTTSLAVKHCYVIEF